MANCRECKVGRLRIIGTGYYGDNVEVECTKCSETYEVEPDGLGQGGLEFVAAQMVEEREGVV